MTAPQSPATPTEATRTMPLTTMDGTDWSHDVRSDLVRIGPIRASRQDWIAALHRLGAAVPSPLAPDGEAVYPAGQSANAHAYPCGNESCVMCAREETARRARLLASGEAGELLALAPGALLAQLHALWTYAERGDKEKWSERAAKLSKAVAALLSRLSAHTAALAEAEARAERAEARAEEGMRRDEKWMAGIREACAPDTITFDPLAFDNRHTPTLEQFIRRLRERAQRGERDTAERVLAWLLTPGTLNDRWLRDSLCKALQDQFGGWDQQVATLCAALASASPETPTQESGR